MIVALLAAIMQTNVENNVAQIDGLNIGNCWSWIARIINEPPNLMTGSILLTILEVAGYQLSKTYKKQFTKLVHLIRTQICPNLSKNTKTGAANAAGQLETFISQYIENRYVIQVPEGSILKETQLTEADEERTEVSDQNTRGHNYAGRGRGRGRGRAYNRRY